jgi:hypothetical protein
MDIETADMITCTRDFNLSCYSYLFLSGEAPEDALSIISLSDFDIIVLLVLPSADRAVFSQNSLLIDSVF